MNPSHRQDQADIIPYLCILELFDSKLIKK